MTEIEKLQRTKEYMDKLAGGIDPISDTEMSGDAVLNNIRLSRCFFYVSDILRQVIENQGVVGRVPTVKQAALPPFTLTDEQREQIEITKEPTMIKHFTERINGLIDITAMQKLKVTAFTSWLLEKGFLFEEIAGDKRRKKPTKAGQNIGIDSEFREGQYGSYVAVLYNENAQRFLVDNLDEIIAFSNGEE